MSDGTVERDPREVSTKDRLLEEIVSLADPKTAKRQDVQTFLGREQFRKTYEEVLKHLAPIIVDDLPSSNEEEGRHLITYLSRGREAFEEEFDVTSYVDAKPNMMTHWKRRYGTIDESLDPNKYQNEKEQRIGEKPTGLEKQYQLELMSKGEKTWAMYGIFAWALARGKPAEAINCLNYIARLKGVDIALAINQFEPVLSLMRRLVGELDEEVVNTSGGLDAIGGSSTAEYIREMDEIMREHEFIFNGEKFIQPFPMVTLQNKI